MMHRCKPSNKIYTKSNSKETITQSSYTVSEKNHDSTEMTKHNYKIWSRTPCQYQDKGDLWRSIATFTLELPSPDKKRYINSTEFQHKTNQQYEDSSKVEEKRNIQGNKNWKTCSKVSTLEVLRYLRSCRRWHGCHVSRLNYMLAISGPQLNAYWHESHNS